MSGLNKVIIIGNVVRIEAKEIASGQVINMCIATSDKYTNKQGEKVENTEWHNCVAFGKTADIISRYVQKGHKLYVEGSLKTEKYTGKDGVERSATKIMIREVQLLERKEQSAQAPQAYNADYANKDNGAPFDDDLPF